MIRVFVGYDSRMPLLHHVLGHSIITKSSEPVSITPLSLKNLAGVFHREHDPNQSTEFSFSRFMTPWLCDYQGWALFIDNDMLCLDDIANLWALRDDQYAVMCVKHDYEVKSDTKFLGERQTKYEKKNWSSVMLLNCAKCTALTPEYVNTATGLQLHQFKWLEDESLIGEIPRRWNYLVGYYDHDPDVSIVHYTDGGPYFKETRNCDYAEDWFRERQDSTYVKQE